MRYLNHAGTSWPKPAAVQAACAKANESDPTSWAADFERAYESIAGFFGIEDKSRLLLTPSCTAALSVGIADHAWEPGDRLVISGYEHHAVHRPAQLLADRGVELHVIGPTATEPFDLEAFEQVLKKGVRLVAVSAAANVTGALLPTRAITKMARAHGALMLVDAAQVAGWMPIDLDVDLFAFAGHKGPRGPLGIGGLYAAPHVMMKSPAASCDIPSNGNAPACPTMPSYCDVGSVNRSSLLGLAAAVAQVELGAPLTRARAQCARFVDGALSLGMTLHGPSKSDARMPTAAVTASGEPSGARNLKPGELARALASRGIFASGGLQCAPLAHQTLGTDPDGVLRVSFGPDSQDDDVDAILEAIREIMRE